MKENQRMHRCRIKAWDVASITRDDQAPDATRVIRNVGKNEPRLEAALFAGANLPTPAEIRGGRNAAVYRASCPPSLPGGPSATEQLIKRLIIGLSGSDSWTEQLPMNDRGHAPLPAAESARTSTTPPAPPHRANLATGWKSPAASTAIAFWSSSYTAADFTSCARVRVQRRWRIWVCERLAPNNTYVHVFFARCMNVWFWETSWHCFLGEEFRGVFLQLWVTMTLIIYKVMFLLVDILYSLFVYVCIYIYI